MKLFSMFVVSLAAAASVEAGQGVVYTNVVDGQRVPQIVRVTRATSPAAPVPASITTTPVLPRNWRPPLGPTSYVPPVPQEVSVDRPYRRPAEPWYVNGIYVGPSPTGSWMSTSVGRPIVDVRIIDAPRRKR